MRITGGAHRSRNLVAPRGQQTRPTSDRVREALFAILGAARPIAGERVLDLYAGTGALGLEALSRGAALVVMVERAKEALDAIRANVTALDAADDVRVVASPVERAAGAIARALRTMDTVKRGAHAARDAGEAADAGEPSNAAEAGEAHDAFDLVFADPPYADVTSGAAVRALAAIAGAGLVAPGARVVLEHGKNDAAPAIAGLALVDTRRYGDTSLSFYERAASPAGPADVDGELG
jgi:16S rRNA (guanine966-N2)-methyltransferase